MTINITRTFDILEHLMENRQRKDALGGKRGKKWYVYSTEEYVNYSKLVGLAMYELGYKPGDKVATVTGNRPEWNIIDMGLAMAGIVHVPIYPTISDDEYRYILEHSEAMLIIAGEKRLVDRLQPMVTDSEQINDIYSFEDLEGVKSFMDILDVGRKASAESEQLLAESMKTITTDDVATLIYTSGTTGEPKGVMLTHQNLVSNFLAHSKVEDLGLEHRAVSFLPLCHVYERSVNYHFIYRGIGVYYVQHLGQLMVAIKEVKPHIFNCVPRLLERIYDGFVSKGNDLKGVKRSIYFRAFRQSEGFEYNKKLNVIKKTRQSFLDKMVYSKWREALGGNVQVIVSGGAALQPRIARLMATAGIPIMEGYGLTETSPVIAVNNPKDKRMKIGTVGPILEGVEVKIADDGEILTRGAHVMKGYYKSPEQTKEVIDEDGWFHTGDIGTLVDGEFLKITDRKKEIFKLSGGKYIAPQMIENMLKESFFIEQVMVIGEHEKFASALISPNYDYLHDWCARNKIRYRNNEELIEHPDVIACFNTEIAATNKELGEHEKIKRVRLVVDEWSSQSGELSPTLKLRRRFIINEYKELIAEIYASKAEKKERAKRRGILRRIPVRFDFREIKKLKPNKKKGKKNK